MVLLDSDVVSVDIWQLVNWPSRWERAAREMGAGKALVLPAFQLTPTGVAASAKRGEAVEVGAMRAALKVVTAGEVAGRRARRAAQVRAASWLGPLHAESGDGDCCTPCMPRVPHICRGMTCPAHATSSAPLPRTMPLGAEAGKFPLKALYQEGKAGVYADHGFASSQAAALPALWFEAGAPSACAGAVLGKVGCAGLIARVWGRLPGHVPPPPATCSFAMQSACPWPHLVLPQVTCTAMTTMATLSCRSLVLRPLS